MATKLELDRAFFKGWMSKIPPATKYLTDEEYECACEIEDDYCKNEYPKVLKQIQAMKDEVPAQSRHEMRRKYLLERIRILKEKYLKTNDKKIGRELRKCTFEAKVFVGTAEGFSINDMIRARQYPITKLIQSKNYMAKCPFHNDHSPSLNLKNNFYFCHGCGEHGDVIDFAMRTLNLSFQDAVRTLST